MIFVTWNDPHSGHLYPIFELFGHLNPHLSHLYVFILLESIWSSLFKREFISSILVRELLSFKYSSVYVFSGSIR